MPKGDLVPQAMRGGAIVSRRGSGQYRRHPRGASRASAREDRMRRTILAALAVLVATTGASLAADKLKVAIPQKGFWDSSWVEFGEAAGFFKEAGLEIEVFYTE